MNISHPQKIVVPVETALATWGKDGAHYFEKLDGEFTIKPVVGGVLLGETQSGAFTAWDCVHYAGDDIRIYYLTTRLYVARLLCKANNIPFVESSFDGAALLKAVLARGGEGVVRKDANASYFQPMIAAKRSQIHVCTVTAIGPGQSIALADASTGQARGKCPAKGGAADVLRVGDRVRVECDSIHDSGLFRSAKLCREYRVK